MARPRPKVTLAAGQVPSLLAALHFGAGDPTAFPTGTERRERLERLQRRIADSRGQAERLDLRIGPLDWDVIAACLGLAAKRRRTELTLAFDQLAERAAPTAVTTAGTPEQVLADLETLEDLASVFGEQAERAGFSRSGRRWILP